MNLRRQTSPSIFHRVTEVWGGEQRFLWAAAAPNAESWQAIFTILTFPTASR